MISEFLLDGANPRRFTNPTAKLSVTDGVATRTNPDGHKTVFESGAFDALEAAVHEWKPYGGTLCGYLSYELAAELENIEFPPRTPIDPPDLLFTLYGSSEPYQGTTEIHKFAAPQVNSIPSGHDFQCAVERTVRRIYDGELFQVNLCRRLETPLASENISSLYQNLRVISPAEHGAFLPIDDNTAILSISPELFLSVKNREVRSCPIKGTRPRGQNSKDDRRLAAELVSSEKDRAELAMIVDVVRNDLGRVCVPGSIKVESHSELVALPTVHHTVSEVRGRLRPDRSLVDLLRAAFPPASISGAPKIRAMEIAAQEEGLRRGPCMGAIGWISLEDDSVEFSVAIRTAVASAGRVWYLAGCGITAESNSADELAESSAKATAFLRALGY